MNEIIWVLREQRSGGTWFVEKCCEVLKRESYFFEQTSEYNKLPMFRTKYCFLNRVQETKDSQRILNTHDFSAVESLHNYTNPKIFRITRRDKTEQFLSLYLSNLTKKSLNVVKYYNVYDKDTLDKLPKYNNLIVEKSAVIQFLDRQKIINDYWNSATSNFECELIYYEDLLQTHHSKLLNLSFNMQEESLNLPIKLPYNKREIFINYDKIDDLINSYY